MAWQQFFSMKHYQQAVKFGIFFAAGVLLQNAYAAPAIPAHLSENSLVYCTSVSGFTFNPQKADIGTNMNVITDQIYDKLFEFDTANQSIKPMLAESYQLSEDGKIITIHLRKKVAFHTTEWFTPSRPLNAEDVVFSLNRVIGKMEELPTFSFGEDEQAQFQRNQFYAYQYKANLAHYPYFESMALRNKIDKITAPSEYVVKIYLNEPDNTILEHLASQYAVILSKEYALQLNSDENLSQLDLLPVGSGAYQLKDYAQNKYVRLIPHKNYWHKPANIENVVIDISTNSIGRIAKFLNGECDIAALPEPSQQSVIRAPNRIVESDGADLAFIAFNTQRPKMQAVSYRRKIAESINRRRLADTLFYGMAEVAHNVLPNALFPVKNALSYPYLPNATGKKMKKTDRLNFWVLDEVRAYNLHPLKMAEMIKADLAQIGIDAVIRPVSRAYVAQMSEQGKADYDLILTGWFANNQDLNAFLNPILSCRTQYDVTNLANWCNEEVDHWLDVAKLSQSKSSKQMIYQFVQSLLEEELPILPLSNTKRTLFINHRIENANINALGQIKISEIKLKSQGNL